MARTTSAYPIEGPSHKLDFDSTGAFVPVSVDGLTITPDTMTIKIGAIGQFQHALIPENASDQCILWTSSDDTIATVDFNGRVTGLKAGKVTITGTSRSGHKVDTSELIVKDPNAVDVTGVTLTPSTASVKVGATTKLTATVAPANATNKKVTYKSSDATKATVDASGTVTGVAAGTATITVTTDDGAKTATSAITVTAAE